MMKRSSAAAFAALLCAFSARGAEEDPCLFVDPFIGTAGTGHTTPAACMPFGLVQAGPDTGNFDWDHCSGYRYGDKTMLGFSQTHLNGTGCGDLGDVKILPFTGEETPTAVAYDKASETAAPGRYAVTLADGTRVEATASAHCAVYRITYPAGARRRLAVDPRWCLTSRAGAASRILSCDTALDGRAGLYGKVVCNNWVKRAYAFRVAFDRPFASARGLVFDFGDSDGRPLLVKVALSALGGVDDAEGNMRAEVPDWDFARVERAACAAWSALLSRVAVEGEADQKKSFYTSLYHLFVQPNDIADAGREPYYSTLSTWDTFRAAHPLYTILVPELVPSFVASMQRQGEFTGYLPVWTLWGRDNQCMIGTHSVPVLVDACLKGFPGAWESVYAQIKETLVQRHEGRRKERWDLLEKHGYYPFDVVRSESVSRTMECAYDDWCAAQMAERLGHDEDAAFFRRRAGNWRNVFDPALRLARPKDSKGRWREPFDPYATGYGDGFDFTEGNAYQYTWHVMQDPDGLVEAMGGRDEFVKRLDALFEAPQEMSGSKVLDISGLIGQYVHGNEPSHHVIYFYTLVGERDKAARRIREVFDKFYLPKPDGLCGNDDCGQMSAWYVFSSLGFYPFNPCGGTYVLGAPQIPKATVALPGGKTLTVIARNLSRENMYVARATFNGRELDKTISHADLAAGGELVFEMTGAGAGK
ncbi:MAG: GH92 family glycosyl hydrolase [Kiritimatiellae bacterium]|nr:GH92 family glycosyl hydrolase [Kiritimatiellia bacterium]